MKQTLRDIGFEEKEAQVYLACLQLGEDTVFNIAKQAQIKRPTTYVILQSLIEKGLISLRKTKKATLYSATNPKKLLTLQKQKTQTLESTIPQLLAIYNLQPKKPEIQVFEGKEGVNSVYLETFEFMKKGMEVIFYGSVSAPMTLYPEITNLYFNLVKKKTSKIREILPQDKENFKYCEKIQTFKNPNHQTRFFTKKYKCGSGYNIIFGNKIAFLPYHKKQYFTILIEHEDLVTTHRTLFEHAWKSAKTIKLAEK